MTETPELTLAGRCAGSVGSFKTHQGRDRLKAGTSTNGVCVRPSNPRGEKRTLCICFHNDSFYLAMVLHCFAIGCAGLFRA